MPHPNGQSTLFELAEHQGVRMAAILPSLRTLTQWCEDGLMDVAREVRKAIGKAIRANRVSLPEKDFLKSHGILIPEIPEHYRRLPRGDLNAYLRELEKIISASEIDRCQGAQERVKELSTFIKNLELDITKIEKEREDAIIQRKQIEENLSLNPSPHSPSTIRRKEELARLKSIIGASPEKILLRRNKIKEKKQARVVAKQLFGELLKKCSGNGVMKASEKPLEDEASLRKKLQQIQGKQKRVLDQKATVPSGQQRNLQEQWDILERERKNVLVPLGRIIRARSGKQPEYQAPEAPHPDLQQWMSPEIRCAVREAALRIAAARDERDKTRNELHQLQQRVSLPAYKSRHSRDQERIERLKRRLEQAEQFMEKCEMEFQELSKDSEGKKKKSQHRRSDGLSATINARESDIRKLQKEKAERETDFDHVQKKVEESSQFEQTVWIAEREKVKSRMDVLDDRVDQARKEIEKLKNCMEVEKKKK